jgi:hypothetical protein
MSCLTYQTQANPFQGMMKDDSAVFPDAVYRHAEVNRPDATNRHLWSKSGFVNSFDSTSDPNCPNNLFTSWEDSWEWPMWDNPRFGGRQMPVWKIQGVTKDSGGSPLGGITVDLFLTAGDIKVDTCISDSAGNYQLWTPYQGQAHYCVATNNSTLAGATVNTLVGQ